MKGRLYRTIILILTICTIVSATAPVATANSSATTAVAAANINDTNNESAPTGQDKYNRSKSVPSETTSQPQAENSNTETESQRRSTPSSAKLSEDVKNKLQTVLEEPTTRATISSSEASSPVTVTRGNVPDDYPLNVIIRVKNKSDFGTVHDRIQSLGSIRSTYPNQYLISAEIPANQFDTLTSVSGIDFIDQNGLVAPDSSHTTANTGGVSTVETGGGGGGGGPPRIINEGPPEVPDVRSTLKLASTQTVVEVQTGGSSTVSPDASTTVSEIAFNADSVDTTVVVKEYGDPPTRVAEEITTSAQSDGVDISSEDDIISLTSVSTDLSAQADDSAIITLTIDRERVDSPASLVVVKDKYSFEQQQETWVAKPTTVTDASNERVVIETAVDEFSMLAVVEKDSAGGGKTSPNESESTSNTSNNETDSSIPLPLFLPVVAIILSASLFAVRE